MNILKQLKNIDPTWKGSLYFSDHHLSHMGSAFYPSPFKKTLILTIDGVGEWTTTAIGIGEENEISLKETLQYPHSVGLLYSAFTQYLGFNVNSGEYKVMGLAPYGEAIYVDIIEKHLLKLNADGSFKLNMDYFGFSKKLSMINKSFEDLFEHKTRKPETEILQFHLDIAASIQKVTEDIVIKMVTYMSAKYKLTNLTMAGGVALNCVANSKIIECTPIENVWVQPASGDAGGSIGAALALYYTHLQNERKNVIANQMKGAQLGPSFGDNDIIDALTNKKLHYKKLTKTELLTKTAAHINDEKIIGWFQGRMEFGPRSLGNRAIIAKANSEKTQKNINLKIKFRESFRPFAPSVLKEKAITYFKPLTGFIDLESPFMLFTYQLQDSQKKEMIEETTGLSKLSQVRSTIQAVTHVDYSARVQTVTEANNQLFYNLIQQVDTQTGYPMVVNTSFNVRGEPIVCTPTDAINCFLKTNMDVLVLGNYMIEKRAI